jgi:hypothetical protein
MTKKDRRSSLARSVPARLGPLNHVSKRLQEPRLTSLLRIWLSKKGRRHSPMAMFRLELLTGLMSCTIGEEAITDRISMIGLLLNKRYWLKSHNRTLSDKANAGVSPFMNHHHPASCIRDPSGEDVRCHGQTWGDGIRRDSRLTTSGTMGCAGISDRKFRTWLLFLYSLPMAREIPPSDVSLLTFYVFGRWISDNRSGE